MNGEHVAARGLIERDLVVGLDAPARADLHAHLRVCDSCRRHHDRSLRALGGLEGEAASFPSRQMLEQVERWVVADLDSPAERRARMARIVRRWIALVTTAAGMTAILVVVRPRSPAPASPPSSIPATTLPSPLAGTPTAPSVGPSPRRSLESVIRGVAPEGIRLLSIDFERGSPRLLKAGDRVAAPPGGHGRFAVKAVRYHGAGTSSVGVRFEDWTDRVFTYDDDLWVTFDYWLGQSLGRPAYVEVAFRCEGARIEYTYHVPDTVQGRWQTLTVHLAAARPYGEPTKKPVPGDRAVTLKIKTNHEYEYDFFVDNVRLLRIPARVGL